MPFAGFILDVAGETMDQEDTVLETIRQYAIEMHKQAAMIIATIESYKDETEGRGTKTFFDTRRCQGCIKEKGTYDTVSCIIGKADWRMCMSPVKEYYGKADKS